MGQVTVYYNKYGVHTFRYPKAIFSAFSKGLLATPTNLSRYYSVVKTCT